MRKIDMLLAVCCAVLVIWAGGASLSAAGWKAEAEDLRKQLLVSKGETERALADLRVFRSAKPDSTALIRSSPEKPKTAPDPKGWNQGDDVPQKAKPVSTPPRPAPSSDDRIRRVYGVSGDAGPLVATSKAAYDRMVKSMARKDTEGVALMVMAGDVLMLEGNPKCRLLDVGFGWNSVRLLEGAFSGTEVWTYSECVR